MERLVISIEGAISVGKTTLVNNIMTYCKLNNIPCIAAIEPIELWFSPYNLINEVECNTELKPIVQLFIFHTLANRMNKILDFKGIVIIERGVLTAMAQFCSDITDPKIRYMMEQIGSTDKLIDYYIPIDISDESNKKNLLSRSESGERKEEFCNMDLETKISYNHYITNNLNKFLSHEDKKRILRFDFDNYNDSFNTITKLINSKNLKLTYIKVVINYFRNFIFRLFK